MLCPFQVKEVLFHERSDFQDVLVFDSVLKQCRSSPFGST